MKFRLFYIFVAFSLLGVTVDMAAQDKSGSAQSEVNVALAKWGATASASSEYGSGYEAFNVLDGKWASRESDKWNSAAGNDSHPHWLQIDLGTERIINRIVIRHEGVLSDGDEYNTADFRVQKGSSNSGPWLDIVPPVKGNTENVTTHIFEPQKTRYLKLLIEKGTPFNNEFGRIFEVEVYADLSKIGSPLLSVEFPGTKYRKVLGKLEIQASIEILTNNQAKELNPVELVINNSQRIVIGGLSSGKPEVVWIPATNEPVELALVVNSNILATRKVHTPIPLNWGYFADGTIHVIASSHNDIAWFDTPAETIARRDHACITPALEKMETRGDVTFCMENVLYLLEYLDRHPEKRAETDRLTANGQFDWGATYNQPYEGLLSGEQLVREVYYGRKLIRKMIPGAAAKVAYNPDVPGRTMQMPQILAKAGIPYLLISRHKEGLFNWYSPDGSSVLTWSMSHYGNMISEGVLGGDFAENSSRVFGHTDAFAKDFALRKIPPHFAFLHSADYIPPADYDREIQEWESNRTEIAGLELSQEFTPPKLQYSSPANFFDAVSAGTPEFETIVGERPDLWLYIHGPTHHKAISAKREAGVLLPAAETFSTIDAVLSGTFNNYPAYELGAAWQASIYDDHGWGGAHGEVTDEVFREKLEFARDKGNEILNRSLENIAARVKSEQSEAIPVVVFNALSWMRSDPVTLSVNIPYAEFHMEDAGGKEIAVQITDKSASGLPSIQFIADNIPSLGYKTYFIKKGKSKSSELAAVQVSETRFENQFYILTLANGGVKSLYDKMLGREILETGRFLGGEVFTMQSVGNGAGEFSEVQQPTMEGFDQVGRHNSLWKVVPDLSGAVSTTYRLEQKLETCTVEQRLIIYNDIKRIDFEIALLNWDGTKSREFRMALPVKMEGATISYEVPMGVVEVGKSEIPGSAGGGYGSLVYDQKCSETRPREVQNFISASNDQFGVTMSSSVAVCDWVDPTTGPVSYPILQPILMASRRSCHGAGNWYLQPGDHHFAFSVFSHEPGWENGYRSGIQANNPLRAIVQERKGSDVFLPTEKSFFSVAENQVLISTIKKCEDDNSIVARLYDILGKDSQVKLETFFPISAGEHTNIIEEEGRSIPVSGHSLKTPIGHHAIETFKLYPVNLLK